MVDATESGFEESAPPVRDRGQGVAKLVGQLLRTRGNRGGRERGNRGQRKGRNGRRCRQLGKATDFSIACLIAFVPYFVPTFD